MCIEKTGMAQNKQKPLIFIAVLDLEQQIKLVELVTFLESN